MADSSTPFLDALASQVKAYTAEHASDFEEPFPDPRDVQGFGILLGVGQPTDPRRFFLEQAAQEIEDLARSAPAGDERDEKQRRAASTLRTLRGAYTQLGWTGPPTPLAIVWTYLDAIDQVWAAVQDIGTARTIDELFPGWEEGS